MGMIDDLKQRASNYLFSIGVKRASAALVGFVMGKVLTAPVLVWLASHGVTLDPIVVANSLEGTVVVGAVALHDWLRVKFPRLAWL